MSTKTLSWKIIALRTFGVLAVAGLVVATPFILQREGFFKIESVEISLNEGVMMPAWLQSEWQSMRKDALKMKGRDLWSLDMDEVVREIKARPWVREVSLSRSWPDALVLSIDPKELKALARAKKGALVPVLEDGTTLSAEQMTNFVSLPIFSGEITNEDPARIKEALRLLSLFPGQGVLSIDRVSEVGFHEKEGYWILVMPFATKVRWGFGDFEKKISRVKQVMEYLDSRQIGARVIDADLSKKVVVRLRKTP
ncbi:MAG: FtsQ-type POTRA domain-containing protein [Bdellovibrionaceae bacterium]|nr:FtsQ-type POTRA domain-containing protein [Pseudobdellovibrionaceae bacterium]